MIKLFLFLTYSPYSYIHIITDCSISTPVTLVALMFVQRNVLFTQWAQMKRKKGKTHYLFIIISLICYTIVFFPLFCLVRVARENMAHMNWSVMTVCVGRVSSTPGLLLIHRGNETRVPASLSMSLLAQLDGQAGKGEKKYPNNNKEKSQGIVTLLCYPEIHQSSSWLFKSHRSTILAWSQTHWTITVWLCFLPVKHFQMKRQPLF